MPANKEQKKGISVQNTDTPGSELTQEQIEQAKWVDYIKTRDDSIREYFAIKYAPLVKYVAGKIAVGMPQNIEFDDLVSYGVFGLLDAINKYDPQRGIKFKTYAVTRIRGAIFDELRSIDWIPRTIRQKSRQLEQVISDLEIRNGRPAEDQEIAEAMNISIPDLHKLITQISGTHIISLNDVWFLGSDDDEMPIIETVESPDTLNPDFVVERDEIKGVIVQAIEKLPEKEKQVIVLYYYEDLTLREIGEVLEVTESRVSQLHTKAIMRLRNRLNRLKTQTPQ